MARKNCTDEGLLKSIASTGPKIRVCDKNISYLSFQTYVIDNQANRLSQMVISSTKTFNTFDG